MTKPGRQVPPRAFRKTRVSIVLERTEDEPGTLALTADLVLKRKNMTDPRFEAILLDVDGDPPLGRLARHAEQTIAALLAAHQGQADRALGY